jgi:hypothetical protein
MKVGSEQPGRSGAVAGRDRSGGAGTQINCASTACTIPLVNVQPVQQAAAQLLHTSCETKSRSRIHC